MTSVKERFIRYVQIETKSNRDVETCPSSPGQFVFARKLVEELKQIGLQDVTLDDNCYVMATLPSNVEKQVPVFGLIAHMDTSPDMSGENVNPQIIPNYDGGNIVLNKASGIVLDVETFPEVKEYAGAGTDHHRWHYPLGCR